MSRPHPPGSGKPPADRDGAPGPRSGVDLARAVGRSPDSFDCHRRRVEWHLEMGHREATLAALIDAFRGLPVDARSDRAHLLRSCRRVVPTDCSRSFDRWVDRGLSPTDPAPHVRGTVLPTGFGPAGGPAVLVVEDRAGGGAHRQPGRRRALLVGLVISAVAVGGAAVTATRPWPNHSQSSAVTVPATLSRRAAPAADLRADRVAEPAEDHSPDPDHPSATTTRRGAPRPPALAVSSDEASTAQAFAEAWAWLLANPDPAHLHGIVVEDVELHSDLGGWLRRIGGSGHHVELDHLSAEARGMAALEDGAMLRLVLELGGVTTVDSSTGTVITRGPSNPSEVPLVLELDAEGGSWLVRSIHLDAAP